MCLAVPGKIVEIYESDGIRMAQIDFGGVARSACLEYLQDASVGNYVLVHVGFAISKVDEEEALRTYRCLEEMDQLADLDTGDMSSPDEVP